MDNHSTINMAKPTTVPIRKARANTLPLRTIPIQRLLKVDMALRRASISKAMTRIEKIPTRHLGINLLPTTIPTSNMERISHRHMTIQHTISLVPKESAGLARLL